MIIFWIGLIVASVSIVVGYVTWENANDPKRCVNGGSWHEFQPRYDERKGSPGKFESSRSSAEDLVKVLTALNPMSKLYVQDVCVHCGKIVARSPELKEQS
jgi:hypothetical protein